MSGVNDKQANGNGEREFLHDLATPLGAAYLLTDSILTDIQNQSNANPELLLRLTKIYQVLSKINEMLRTRREVLKKNGGAVEGP